MKEVKLYKQVKQYARPRHGKGKNIDLTSRAVCMNVTHNTSKLTSLFQKNIDNIRKIDLICSMEL